MVPIEGTQKEIPVDLVLIAAGFLGSEGYVAESFGVKLNARTNVETVNGSYRTGKEKIFTAGDMHRGQSLVVWAIAEGREAAKEVDKSLMDTPTNDITPGIQSKSRPCLHEEGYEGWRPAEVFENSQ